MNENNWKAIILLLKAIAQDKKLTQEEIAARTGLHQSNVNRMLNLKHPPRLDTFLLVAQAIGVNFFLEDKEGTSDLNLLFDKAMTELGRRTKPPSN
jgi:transcriptional regulator with XRE-family HTH domain